MTRKKTEVTIAFGAALRARRVELDYSQDAFAAHAHIDRSYYGAIERGELNVSLETILKLAAALGLPAAKLLRRAEL
jgi:transcriptional regulator with XRE-family HTH domain